MRSDRKVTHSRKHLEAKPLGAIQVRPRMPPAHTHTHTRTRTSTSTSTSTSTFKALHGITQSTGLVASAHSDLRFALRTHRCVHRSLCSTLPRKLMSFSWSSRSSHADDTVAGCQSMRSGTAATHRTAKNVSVLECFPYVCPEPVLVK